METFDSDAGEALEIAFEAMIADWAAVTRHTMFGHPTYKAGGTIFALLRTDAVVLTRLPDDERDALAAERESGPFEAGDQTIESWVEVPIGPDDLEEIRPFVRTSHEAALGESRSVPPPADEE